MSFRIQRIEFTQKNYDEVQNFKCGDSDYALEVSNWIKAPFGQDGASTSISDPKRPSKVYLYYLETEGRQELLAYGALAPGNFPWKRKGDPRIPATTIVWFGVGEQFHSQPKDAPREKRYSHLVFNDILSLAELDVAERPTVTLLVHPGNAVAIRFYESFDFATGGLEGYQDGDVSYVRMFRILDDGIHEDSIETAYNLKKKTRPAKY